MGTGCRLIRMIQKVLFWCVMIRTALFAVAAADMIGQVFAGFGVDIPGKLPYCSTGWAGVAGGRGFVRLKAVHGDLGIG